MKKLILGFTLSSLISPVAFAEGHCSDPHNTRWHDGLSTEQCVTVGAAAGAATASGIYSAVKYGKANSIVDKNTIVAFSEKEGSVSAYDINRTNSSFTNGDRITIDYQLNAADNRAYHIDSMEANASSARTSGAFHATMALTATRTVTESGPNNTTTTRVEPDYAARLMHAGLAANAYSEAREYDAKAANARAGGPVPIYDFDKVIDASEGTAKLSADFVKGHTEGGGKILKIARLPVEHFNAFKATVWKGRGGAVAAVTMLGLGAIEAKEGYAAEEARKAQFVPKVNENVIQPTVNFFSNAVK